MTIWSLILEKAFAKLCGSYEALISGFADSAMRTLTGGAPMRLRLRPTTPTPAAAAPSRAAPERSSRPERPQRPERSIQRPDRSAAQASAASSAEEEKAWPATTAFGWPVRRAL